MRRLRMYVLFLVHVLCWMWLVLFTVLAICAVVYESLQGRFVEAIKAIGVLMVWSLPGYGGAWLTGRYIRRANAQLAPQGFDVLPPR